MRIARQRAFIAVAALLSAIPIWSSAVGTNSSWFYRARKICLLDGAVTKENVAKTHIVFRDSRT